MNIIRKTADSLQEGKSPRIDVLIQNNPGG